MLWSHPHQNLLYPWMQLCHTARIFWSANVSLGRLLRGYCVRIWEAFTDLKLSCCSQSLLQPGVRLGEVQSVCFWILTFFSGTQHKGICQRRPQCSSPRYKQEKRSRCLKINQIFRVWLDAMLGKWERKSRASLHHRVFATLLHLTHVLWHFQSRLGLRFCANTW